MSDIIRSLKGLYVIIDRIGLAAESRICIQKVPESIYSAEYPVHIFTKEEILSQMGGYELVEENYSMVDNDIRVGNMKIEYKVLCFRRKVKEI